MENMEVKKQKVLVTGGAGFIGSHLVDELVNKNYQVVVVDDLSSGKKENVNPRAKFYQMDVRSKKIFDILKKENIDTLFHFAAKPIVEEVYENPLEALDVNIMGTANVLEACRKKGNLKSIVIVSSDKAYGKSSNLPYKESHPLQGDHPYDVSKSSADLIAQAYFTTYGLPVVITRFSNVFGPRDVNFSRIIPGALESIIKNKKLPIRSDGTMVREYTYVKDIAEGCMALTKKPQLVLGRAFNFGSKNIFSVIEVVENIQLALEKKIDYKILNTAKNEIPKQYLDWSKAKKKLGWQPKTSFEQGIKETFDWYKNSHFEN